MDTPVQNGGGNRDGGIGDTRNPVVITILKYT